MAKSETKVAAEKPLTMEISDSEIFRKEQSTA
jgi:hypothetical protein